MKFIEALGFKAATVLALSSSLLACSGKTIGEVLGEQQGDPSKAGVVKVERRANGTLFLQFKGLIGAESYVVYETEKPVVEKSVANLWGLLANPEEKKSAPSDRARMAHVVGKSLYDVETSYIPFGEEFCYVVKASMKEGGDQTLGSERCLANDQNWRWKGLSKLDVDGSGRVLLEWRRLPVAGTTYEVGLRFKDVKDSSGVLQKVVDLGTAVDENKDDKFPRCYVVNVCHPLFSGGCSSPEAAKEMCLDKPTWEKEKVASLEVERPDVEAPRFEGIARIEAIVDQSLLSRVSSAVGLTQGVTVHLSWKEAIDDYAPSRRIRYRIYRADNPSGYDFAKPLAETEPGVLSFKDTSIEKGAVYYYLVRAVDEGGNEDQNFEERKLPLDLAAPTFAGVVTGTTKRVAGQVRVLLAWNSAQDDNTAPQGIKYEIYRSQSEGDFPGEPISSVTGVTSFEDGSTQASQVYFYKVLAVDEKGNRDSNQASVRVNTGETPPKFEGLLEARLFNRTARLRWDPAEDDESPTNAILYRVYRREESGEFNFRSPIIQTTAGVLQFEDASINPNRAYFYLVRAVDEQGFEDQNTTERQMAANQAPVLSAAPVVTWDKTQKCAKVAWQPATDDTTSSSAMKYRVFRGSSSSLSSFNFGLYEELAGGARQYVDQGTCDKENGYFYIVRAVDGDDAASPNSPVGSIPPNQPPTPGTVTQVSVSGGTQVLLKWNSGTDDRTSNAELRYRVYRFPKAPVGQPKPARVYNNTTLLTTVDANVREFLDPTGAATTQEYSWLIRPVDEFGTEGINVDDEVSLDTNLPPSFGGLTTVSLSGFRSVNLAWTLASDDRTTRNLITYRVHMIEVPAGTPIGTDPANPVPESLVNQLFAAPHVEQILGEVATLTRQVPDANKMYLFGVRAFDAQGLADVNRRVVGVPANGVPNFGGVDTATELAGGGVRLSWLTASDDKDPSNQILYRVYRLTSSNATETAETVRTLGTLHRTSAAGATSLDDDAVVPGANNHYLVRAVDLDQAEDGNAVVRTILRDDIAPVFLGIKTATMENEGTRIRLVWDAASDNRTQTQKIRYRVYEGLDPAIPALLASPPIAELTNGLTNFSRTPPTAAKWHYLVRAVDEAGNPDAGDIVKFTVDEIPPTFPGLIAGYPITGSSAQVFWTSVANDDIEKVRIYRAEDLANPIASVNARDLEGNWVNSYLVTGLTTATSYTFMARASDLYGNEEQNVTARTVTTLAGASPTFAGLQSAEPLGGIPGLGAIRLSWSPASDATHYRIFRVPGPSERGDEFNLDYTTCSANWGAASLAGCFEVESSGTTSYEVTGLVKNTTYSFIVRAVTKSGSELMGEELNRVIRKATTLDEVAPTFDGAKTANPAAGSAGLTTVVLNWDSPKADGVYDGFRVVYKTLAAPATSFNLPTDLSTDPSLNVVVVGDPSVREVNVTGLTYNTRTCFTVVTRYTAQPSVRSVPTGAGFQCTSPVPQAPLFAGVKSDVARGEGGLAFTQLTVSWEPAQGSFTAYEVSWSKVNDFVTDAQPGSFFGAANKATLSTRLSNSHVISGLEPNTTYYLRVRAKFELASPSISLTSGSSVVAQAATTPKVPTGDGVLLVKQVDDDQAEIRWAAPNNGGLFNTYYLFRAEGPNAEADVVAMANVGVAGALPYAAPPFVGAFYMGVSSSAGVTFDQRVTLDNGLNPNVKYCYLVKAAFYNANQGFVSSPNVAVKCVEVEIKPPSFAGIVSVKTPASAAGFNTLIAQWAPATGKFSMYQYAFGLTPEEAQTWNDVSGGIDTTQATISGLLPNTTYFVKVRAVYVKNGQPYASGETALASGITSPKAPQHAGLEPVQFLTNPGEVRLRWDAPAANAEVGGVYDRFLLWKFTGGSAAAIFQEISTLMKDGYISETEVASSSYHVLKLDKTVTQQDFIGTSGTTARLPENVETCFLVRAAYLLGTNFVMSSNQVVRCVTPTASAPLFGGMADLQNIPLSVNGFSQLRATWTPATGNFTRYEIAVTSVAGSSSWNTVAFSSGNVATAEAVLSQPDAGVPQSTTNKLNAFVRYYARVRAVYIGSGNAIYSAGDSSELSEIVSPDAPEGDGLKNVEVDKVAGLPPSARLTINGAATGFWDRVYIFRATSQDESAARAEVLAKSQVNALNTAFAGSALDTKLRPSANSTSDFSYVDESVTLGQWNCYLVRSAYGAAPWFLGSRSAQTPVCRQPSFQPVSFSGVASAGSGICQEQTDPANPQPCDSNARWPYSGNSRVVLKLSSVPQGDFDFYDVYYGYAPDAQEIIDRGVYQSILKGDSEADAIADDDLLVVGGQAEKPLPGANLYFLVRARCLGCTFNDTNTNVSNLVQTQRPWLSTSFDFLSDGPNFTLDRAGPGRFEDPLNYQNLNGGAAELNGADDFLRATHPGRFAPRPGSTLALKFNLTSTGDAQNVDGAALFAADSSPRAPYWENVNNAFQYHDGSLFGINGASTVYDRRSGRCLWIGGYAGSAMDLGDYPSRAWVYDFNTNNRAFASRMQSFDGRNFAEIHTFERGTSPLPRSLPVVAYNPARDTVWLFGGIDQGVPAKLRADTWEWDGREWKVVDAGPSTTQTVAGALGRYGSGVMAFDPFRQEMVMVGGKWGVPEVGNVNDPARSQARKMAETSDSALDVLTKKTRTLASDGMMHFGLDAATGTKTWRKTSNLPSSFPKGYPAALVAIPTDKNPGDGVDTKGLYYFSVTWSGTDAPANNNVWRWNGDAWIEIGSSRIPDNTPHSNFIAFYDEVKDKIVLTFGRGNNIETKRVWEWSPAAGIGGAGVSAYAKRYLSDAPPTFSGTPCWDFERRLIVDHGGYPVSESGYDVNARTNVRERTPQDVYLYDLSLDTWRRATPGYDYSGQGSAYSASKARRGVFAQGGVFLATYPQWWGAHGTIGNWQEWMTAFTSWSFTDGLWKRLFDTDTGRKWQTFSTTNIASQFALPIEESGTEKLHVVGPSSWADTNPVSGRGRPSAMREFDGVGWDQKTMDASDITFPEHLCPGLTEQSRVWNFHPHWNTGWQSVNTSWGVFMKGPAFSAHIPWNPDTGQWSNISQQCAGPQTWRYVRSPYVLARKESGAWKAREVKAPGAGLPADPFKWCATVGTSAANPDLDPNFKMWPTRMIWDEAGQRILVLGYDYGHWTRYQRNIQAIRRKEDPDPNKQCFYVENITAPFPNASWTQLEVHNQDYDQPLWDPARGKFMVLSNNWVANAQGQSASAATSGFLWELNLNNVSPTTPATWTFRALPPEYRRWSVLAGNTTRMAVPIPGKPGEFLLQASYELHSNRALSNSYILKVTDSAITLRPVPPRFGVTLGPDRTSGWISVPGDRGDADGTLDGQPTYAGRRKFTNDLTGDRTLFLVFGTNTYSVYLDGALAPLATNIPWSGTGEGIYLQDFILGARWGQYMRFGDPNLRQFSGIGNTRSLFDWVRVFDKALTPEEMSWWANQNDGAENTTP